MLKVYERVPFHRRKLPTRNDIPLRTILCGTSAAYLNVKNCGADDNGNIIERVVQFRVLPCKKEGNCLFQVLFHFLRGIQEHVKSQEEVREACVRLITNPDCVSYGRGGREPHNNWRKYRLSVTENLKNRVEFFKSYYPKDDAEEDVEEFNARKQYSEFMLRDSNSGTSTEMSAAMECYNFNVTLIKQNEKIKRYFEVIHLDNKVEEGGTEKPRAYIMLTHDTDEGHFQLLEPADDHVSYCLEETTYQIDDYNVEDRMFTLVPQKAGYPNNDNIFRGMMTFCKNLFKRKLPDPSDDLDSVVLQKRMKRECNQNPDVAIRRANLNPQECIYLIQAYAEQVTRLRHEFEKDTCCVEIFPGVCKSRILTLETVSTAFIRFQPKSWTEFSIANYDTTFIIQRGGSITLRTVSVGTCKIEHENEPMVQSCPFKITKGTQYALQNDLERKTVLLRFFWRCVD